MGFISTLPKATGGSVNLTSGMIAQSLKNRLALVDCQECEKVICVGMFFDGTDNNLTRDEKDGEETNVVRLLNQYPEKLEHKGYFRHYAPGVGTQFTDIGDEDRSADPKLYAGSSLGGPFGDKGAHRIIWGIMKLFNDICFMTTSEKALFSDSRIKALGNTVSGILDNALQPDLIPTQLANELLILKKSIEPFPKSRVIRAHVSVYGFSRGAAEARTFCTWLKSLCEYKDGLYILKGTGVEINLQYLGIFDTVASVGSADMFNMNLLYPSGGITTLRGHNGWGRPEFLRIDGSFVKRTLHLVAGHEMRVCFPSDLAALPGGAYPNNCDEYVYPGAHSSVGGGYSSGRLGCYNDISKIALQHMFIDAIKAGVPFNPEVSGNAWTVSPEAAELFNKYNAVMAKLNMSTPSSSMYEHQAAYFNMRYWCYIERFYETGLIDSTVNSFPRPTIPPKHFKDLLGVQTTQSYFIEVVRSVQNNTVKGLSEAVSTWQEVRRLYFQDRNTRPYLGVSLYSPVFRFLALYVHDSSAGFIDKLKNKQGEYEYNGTGFVRFRSIYAGNETDIRYRVPLNHSDTLKVSLPIGD